MNLTQYILLLFAVLAVGFSCFYLGFKYGSPKIDSDRAPQPIYRFTSNKTLWTNHPLTTVAWSGFKQDKRFEVSAQLEAELTTAIAEVKELESKGAKTPDGWGPYIYADEARNVVCIGWHVAPIPRTDEVWKGFRAWINPGGPFDSRYCLSEELERALFGEVETIKELKKDLLSRTAHTISVGFQSINRKEQP